MNTFLKQTSVYNNIIIRSKHNNNLVTDIDSSITFAEFNACKSVVFRLGLVNYVYDSLSNLIVNAINNPSRVVVRKSAINCFAISEILEIWESYEETRDADYIEELENILAYFFSFKQALAHSRYKYQDQISESEMDCHDPVPIGDYYTSVSKTKMLAFNKLYTYYATGENAE